ncbi:hypothetical protein [Nocardia sp. NBC_01009]|uniref:hypothetical protein n=1 Tax=Nocardia sp. NBC_01009 TaxID=2975996 RepID=UPI00386D1891|nr:hypothetical protein OHA42_17260 [Nocardia sp. NBC_01009]
MVANDNSDWRIIENRWSNPALDVPAATEIEHVVHAPQANTVTTDLCRSGDPADDRIK